jgi:hypothetical protein
MPQTLPKPVSKKCDLCGKRIFARYKFEKYCPVCAHFEERMNVKRFSRKAKKSIRNYIRKYGFRCSYTKILLELDDDTSPWYCVFDHCTPGDPRKIVITSALFNEIKTDLTAKEFRYVVLMLDDHRKKHKNFKKIDPSHWRRLIADGCCICGRERFSVKSKYCLWCSRISYRMWSEKLPQESKKSIWDYIHKHDYVDYYTQRPLNMDDPKSPWYCVFDHWTPHDPKKIVLTSYLINDMKNDLTEDEFWYFISQLANHFRYGTPVRKRKLEFWARPYAPV